MNPNIELLHAEFEQLGKLFPGTPLPPNCFTFMKADYVDYESRMILKISFPVLPEYLNPMLGMQGGFIVAAFDNVFGPLSYLSARMPCTTLDLHSNYIRPILVRDTLVITAKVVSRGLSTLHMSGEAANAKGKLIATCSTHMMIMKK